jgi:AraC-like DNA-binding protein
MVAVNPRPDPRASAASAWRLARFGEFRTAIGVARQRLAGLAASRRHERVDLHLVCACCAIRQGDHAAALREIDAAGACADGRLLHRVDAWRAELAYYQGRYSDAHEIVDRLLPALVRDGDTAYAAFLLRTRIAMLMARGRYDEIAALAEEALALARASADDYVEVQLLNVLGAAAFDRATSKLRAPHARAHLSSLDLRDAAPMEADAREALVYFRDARAIAERSGNLFAAWYVAGNIERIEILLGNVKEAIPAMRRRLRALQARGARYDEIVTRSNLAWALRIAGRYREALHELDTALRIARETGTANVMLEYLEYDRSIVQDALGDAQGARGSYRRYLQLVGAYNRNARSDDPCGRRGAPKAPLEPWFLKRADRYVAANLAQRLSLTALAAHCGVSCRTIEKAFSDFRGTTPMAHIRNARLDQAHQVLSGPTSSSIEAVARACGFASSTTFSIEFRKRFGTTPSRVRQAGVAGKPATSPDP